MINEEKPGEIRNNDCVRFLEKWKAGLPSIAKKCGQPLGKFLVADASIRFEKRGPLMTMDQANSVPTESKDELIKVFEPGAAEPKSLVDFPECILNICASRIFRTARLYFVGEDDKTISKIKREIGGLTEAG